MPQGFKSLVLCRRLGQHLARRRPQQGTPPNRSAVTLHNRQRMPCARLPCKWLNTAVSARSAAVAAAGGAASISHVSGDWARTSGHLLTCRCLASAATAPSAAAAVVARAAAACAAAALHIDAATADAAVAWLLAPPWAAAARARDDAYAAIGV